MKTWFLFSLLCWLACGTALPCSLAAQEAGSGFDLRATLSGEAVASNTLTDEPRNGAPATAGFRGVAYPTWKISNNWFVTGAVQLATRPYFYADFSTPGFGAKGHVLQASLNYSRVSATGSLLLRAGQLETVFGSFPLRYDDADNPLVDLPIEYGYYYSPVSVAGVTGAELDVTRGRFDARAQFANSSASNPRSIFAHDQYGNWAGGAGYTIHQGFRVGVSGYRGPYLDRQSPFFFPGEANPSKTPAHALGADLSWARGHTSAQAEVQKFVFPYTVIPTFAELAAYAEVKQAVSPRWYLATRLNLTSAKQPGQTRALECAAGFRPNRWQLLKFDYEVEHYDSGTPHNGHTVAVQLVTTLHAAAGRN